jgi:hypothetical protein
MVGLIRVARGGVLNLRRAAEDAILKVKGGVPVIVCRR